MLIFYGLVFGLIFGIAFEKSHVYKPDVLIGQFLFKDFTMIKVFVSAIITSMILILLMTNLGWATLHIKPTVYLANALGGLILGGGIAIAGACPGTVYAQIGAGYRDAPLVFLGGLVGVLFYGTMEPSVEQLLGAQSAGKISLADISGLSLTSLTIAFVIGMGLMLTMVEKHFPTKK